MRINKNTQLSLMLFGLASLAAAGSLCAVVGRQAADRALAWRTEDKRASEAALSAIDKSIDSLLRDVHRYSVEERARSLYAGEVERQITELGQRCLALRHGRDSIARQRGLASFSFPPDYPQLSGLPVTGRLGKLAGELSDNLQQFDEQWRKLRLLKKSQMIYWGHTGEKKMLEYVFLRLSNALARPGSVPPAGILSTKQKEFVTAGLSRWQEEMKPVDTQGADLLGVIQSDIMMLLTLSDPALARGWSSGDGHVVSVPEIIGRLRLAHQSWVLHVNQQLSQDGAERRRVMALIDEQLIAMNAGATAMQREWETQSRLVEGTWRQRERRQQYLSAGIGFLGFVLVIPFLFWVGRWTRALAERAQDIARRADRTRVISAALSDGFRRQMLSIVEQATMLTRVSDSFKVFLAYDTGLPRLPSREEELVRDSRASVEEGLTEMKDFQIVSQDVRSTSMELLQVLPAVEGVLDELSQVLMPTEGGNGPLESSWAVADPAMTEQALALVERVRGAIHYSEKVLDDHLRKSAEAADISTEVSRKFVQLGEVSHQLMAMISRMSAAKETQREYLSQIMRDMAKLVQAVQANAWEIKNNRQLTEEMESHLEITQELSADLTATARGVEVQEVFARAGQERRREERLTAASDEEQSRRLARQEQVEKYFETFLKTPQLGGEMQDTKI